MEILTKRPYSLKDTAVCIGKFDGLHSGHQLLLHAIQACQGLKKVLFTFSFPKNDCIYSQREKKRLAAQMGMDYYIECPFDQELSQMSPNQFLEQVLIQECGAKVISVGEDFRFGYEREGDVDFLQEQSSIYGYELKVFEKKKMDGIVVSSTRIRAKLQEGGLPEVNRLLGHPYFIFGEVLHGNQIGGKVLHMPTANQIPEKGKLLPPFGVYASQVQVDGKNYLGVTNIGVKPTIPGENQVGVETYLMDFNGDLYGKNICVELFEFLRGEMKFSGLEELRMQMEKDKQHAIRFFEQ